MSTTVSIYLTLPNRAAGISTALQREACVIATQHFNGQFYAFQSDARQPEWAQTLTSTPGLSIVGDFPSIESKNAGALLVLTPATGTPQIRIPTAMRQRQFILAFGTGWQRIREDDWLEPTFGRTVVLNCVPTDQLLELRMEQVFALKHTATDRAPIPSRKEVFDLDADRDLLEIVEGKSQLAPSNELHALLPRGARMRGGIGLRVSIDLSRLDQTLLAIFKEFQNTAYRQVWPEVDSLLPVRDDQTVLALENSLDAMLRGTQWPAQLQIVAHGKRGLDGQYPEHFVIGRRPVAPAGSTIPTIPVITESAWRSYLAAKSLTASLLTAKETPVHCYDDSLEELFETRVFNCLSAEVAHGGQTYVLSEGRWFGADPAFLRNVTNELRPLVVPSQLPLWNGADAEATYNSAAANAGNYILLDARNINYGGGASKIEVCDFLDPVHRVMYFVKKANTSAPLSHVCEQVRRCAELVFGQDSGFRAAMAQYAQTNNLALPADLTSVQRPNAGDWKLAIVILTSKQALQLRGVPLFGKCSLRRTSKNLQQLGHDVEIHFR